MLSRERDALAASIFGLSVVPASVAVMPVRSLLALLPALRVASFLLTRWAASRLERRMKARSGTGKAELTLCLAMAKGQRSPWPCSGRPCAHRNRAGDQRCARAVYVPSRPDRLSSGRRGIPDHPSRPRPLRSRKPVGRNCAWPSARSMGSSIATIISTFRPRSVLRRGFLEKRSMMHCNGRMPPVTTRKNLGGTACAVRHSAGRSPPPTVLHKRRSGDRIAPFVRSVIKEIAFEDPEVPSSRRHRAFETRL